MTSTNKNNNDYFNHSNSNGLNAAAMNSMTNNILQNKSCIEINRSIKRPVFIFSDEQTSDKINLNSTVFSSMGLIAKENSNESHRTIMTKRNHSSASVSREASDATSTTIVTSTSTTYTASTTVSTITTVISAVAKAF
ncbi:unnamed protein product [Rhizophagus irregularis]|nr:unnamed protein product [Rhizophagus irregularis]